MNSQSNIARTLKKQHPKQFSNSKYDQTKNYNQRQIQTSLKDFQVRLDTKIQKVVYSMMSKTNIQQSSLPAIDQSQDFKQSSLNLVQPHQNNKQKKSKSFHQERLTTVFKNTCNYFQNTDHQDKLKSNKHPSRSIGNKIIKKPKIVARRAQILPKQIRNNPFCEPMPVTVNQINKGLFNLLNKGVIAKDVDISTAFERGQPPMKSKGAVLHNFQQKMVKQQILLEQPIVIKDQKNLPTNQVTQKNRNHYLKGTNGWALTALYNNHQDSKIQKKQENYQQRMKSQIFTEIKDIQQCHFEFKNFKIVQSVSLIEFRKRNYDKFRGIITVIKQIQKFLKKYAINIAFVDAKRVTKIAFLMKKVKQRQILQCFVGSIQDRKRLISLKYIQNSIIKQKLGIFLINKLIKMYLVRKKFIKNQNRKISQMKIINWLKNKILYRKLKNTIQSNKQKEKLLFDKIQYKFMSQYNQIKKRKHYEIHIPNLKYDQKKQQFYQKMNVQITRIFNIKDQFIHVVYICPFPLSSEITNYYYKILELGQVPNYKERITFIQSDPKKFFNFRFSNSKKLFYSSKSIRKLKEVIKDHPSYIISGYALQQDIKLSTYLKIPLLYNHEIGTKLDLRSQARHRFKQLMLNIVPSISIDPNYQGSLIQILIKINKLYSQTKCRKYIAKINNTNDGIGLATIGYPISNIEELYAKTTIIYPNYYSDIKNYYIQLLKKGGVIEKNQNASSAVSVSLFFKPDGQYQILGTFDKISNNYTNIAYSFPQQSISNQLLMDTLKRLIKSLREKRFFGFINIGVIIDSYKNICFNKVKCYLTKETSSLFYFRYLMNGKFQDDGSYLANVTNTLGYDDQNKKPLQKIQQRTYLYAPFILHFGLSQMQIKNFFQLCRIQGISFDLEKKFGSTFILIDSLKSSIGLLTTGRHLKTSLKLMILTLTFLLKQNYRYSNDHSKQKQLKYRQKCNISSVKARLEELNSELSTIDDDSIN